MTSDGDEDCFVVARNSRSAQRVEIDYCGFDPGEVKAVRVKPIAKETLRQWKVRLSKQRGEHL